MFSRISSILSVVYRAPLANIHRSEIDALTILITVDTIGSRSGRAHEVPPQIMQILCILEAALFLLGILLSGDNKMQQSEFLNSTFYRGQKTACFFGQRASQTHGILTLNLQPMRRIQAPSAFPVDLQKVYLVQETSDLETIESLAEPAPGRRWPSD
jgi:hypothetical protein